ncbi:RNA 3'-terminal phosphate cyclase domain-containing protein [Lentinula detonsa]|uniref:RNA 3'-terminal-phosphate cyclase (ATP) n=1 Tax=Lentinula detonsa TaxID=2804962 RepID=A0A9W8TVV0_9AGAR|nr:RNA 3'-terminal phosphate cyclase domain-containing protein [Lentinula detonsa]
MNISINGSVLEGGGQILRNSVTLSALSGKAIHIHQIRNGRKPPGLKNQHRTGLQLAAEIASAKLTGATNGSTEIEFTPGALKTPGDFVADSVTAGSTTLLLQIALPLLLFASQPSKTPSRLTLKGGTNATHAPQIDYTENVFLPFVRRFFGIRTELQVNRRGYYPKGGGEVLFSVTPLSQCLKSFGLLERGNVRCIKGIAHFAKLPGHIGPSMVDGAKKLLSVRLAEDSSSSIPIEIQSRRERNDNTVGAGSGVVLWAELEGGGIIGGSAVGTKGIDASLLGEKAAQDLLRGLDAGGCVDEWLEDQIIIFMALAEGDSAILCGKGELQLHTRTAIWVAEQLTEARFNTEQLESGHTIIRCKGIGYRPSASSDIPC